MRAVRAVRAVTPAPGGDLLLLCATPGEAGPLAGAAPLTTPHRLVFTGIGPVNTAHALTRAVEAARPALVLQFGIAGAYVPAGLPVGALALATEEGYGDLGVLTPQGWQPADLIASPSCPRPRRERPPPSTASPSTRPASPAPWACSEPSPSRCAPGRS